MPVNPRQIKSVLIVEINPADIQACLIEKKDGIYHLTGVERTPVSHGLQGSLDRKCLVKVLGDLGRSTGHKIIGENNEIISPDNNMQSGVDRVCLTWLFPSSLKAVLIGLMPAWSMKAGNRLLGELPLDVVDRISITDNRTEGGKIDTILSLRPDVILLTGGIDNGSTEVVKSSVDLIVRALSGLPAELRPEVIYAGNSQVADYAKNLIEPLTLFFIAPNIQPALDVFDIQPAREILSGSINRLGLKRQGIQPGTKPISYDCLRLSYQSIENFISILGLSKKRSNGMVAVQLNELMTGISIALDGRGMSYPPRSGCKPADTGKLIGRYQDDDIAAWCPVNIEPVKLVDHMAAQLLHPGRLPVTSEDAVIWEGLTRVAGMHAWRSLCEKHDFPRSLINWKTGAEADLILAGGYFLQHQENQNMTLLEILDIIQPVGICDVFLDINNLAASLGTAAQLDPLIPIHCIAGGAVPLLATIITPVFKGRVGTKLLKIIVKYEDGTKTTYQIRSGDLSSIPVDYSRKARITIVPGLGVNLGSRFTRNQEMPIEQSLLGVVVDARGRPLEIKKDPKRQQEQIKHNIGQVKGLTR